jgi:hypothetical protein
MGKVSEGSIPEEGRVAGWMSIRCPQREQTKENTYLHKKNLIDRDESDDNIYQQKGRSALWRR